MPSVFPLPSVAHRIAFMPALLALFLSGACTGDSPSTPTTPTPTPAPSTPAPAPAPPPAPILPANLRAQGPINVVCRTGLCSEAVVTVANTGSGCATGAVARVRFFGGDGAGPQLGIDVPMGMPGGSLAAYVFRPGSTLQLVNLISFNDVRSAHTVYRLDVTWRDIACP